jgi:hypothetical protein
MSFDDVGEFNRKFGLPHLGDGRAPTLLTPDIFDFRIKFLREELREIEDAHVAGDLAAFFDGLIDLTYVAQGTAHFAALPWHAGWAEVQRANMSKERVNRATDPRSTRGHHLDVIKPPGFVPPNLARVLFEHVRRVPRAVK